MQRPVFHLPARDIPVPSSISEQAQAMLAMGPLMPDAEYPPLDDHDAWRAMIAERESAVLAMLTAARPGAPNAGPLAMQVDEIDPGGFPVYVVLPAGVSPDDRRVYLDIHGGAWIQGGFVRGRGRGRFRVVSSKRALFPELGTPGD